MHSFTNSLFRHAIVNADVENPLADLMSRLPKRTWTDDPTAFMVIPLTPLSEVSFLRSLFLQVANCSAFFSNGRIVFYAFVSGRELYYMTAKSDEKNLIRYRYCSVLYQTFFDMEVLDKFKWDCFLPEIKHKNVSTTIRSYLDEITFDLI